LQEVDLEEKRTDHSKSKSQQTNSVTHARAMVFGNSTRPKSRKSSPRAKDPGNGLIISVEKIPVNRNDQLTGQRDIHVADINTSNIGYPKKKSMSRVFNKVQDNLDSNKTVEIHDGLGILGNDISKQLISKGATKPLNISLVHDEHRKELEDRPESKLIRHKSDNSHAKDEVKSTVVDKTHGREDNERLAAQTLNIVFDLDDTKVKPRPKTASSGRRPKKEESKDDIDNVYASIEQNRYKREIMRTEKEARHKEQYLERELKKLSKY
jgi:hypothetical protein